MPLAMNVHFIHVLLQYFQNAPTYFATAIRYACKMFMKLMHVANIINT